MLTKAKWLDVAGSTLNLGLTFAMNFFMYINQRRGAGQVVAEIFREQIQSRREKLVGDV